MEPLLGELAAILDRAVPPGANHVRQGPLWAVRFDRPTEPDLTVYEPMLCVVAQGAKELLVGDARLRYGAGGFLLNTLALPASGGVAEASPARPCLWTMVELDPALIAEVAREAGGAKPPATPVRAVETTAIPPDLLGAVTRLACLLETPDDAAFLRPLLMREIVYRLFRSGQADRLRQIAASGGASEHVLRAVDWLRGHYREPTTVEELARRCGLSPSAFHRRFKRVTAMTPVQFQRRMRLQEAKRLMVAEGLDATTAGSRVGYDDPSYFSREYRRFFGDPPRRHVERLRDAPTTASLAYP